MKIWFELNKMPDERTGVLVDTLVKFTDDGGKQESEAWCTVQDLDRLFDTCVRKWGSNWDLEKVVVAIQESEIL